MSSLIGHEDREIGRLVKLDAQVQRVRAVGTELMEQDDRRGTFGTAEEPSARGAAILIVPGFLGYLRSPGTKQAIFIGGNEVAGLEGSGGAIDQPDRSAGDGGDD